MNETKITHGIYWKGKPITRASFHTHILEQYHFLSIEPDLFMTLKKKIKSWKNKVEYLEFTYGYNENYAVITIVSPKDQFNHKIGYTITKGRLEKAEKILERDGGLIDGFIQVVQVGGR